MVLTRKRTHGKKSVPKIKYATPSSVPFIFSGNNCESVNNDITLIHLEAIFTSTFIDVIILLLVSAPSPCGGWRSNWLFLLYKLQLSISKDVPGILPSADSSFSLDFALNDESENLISESSSDVSDKLMFSFFYSGN